MMHGKKNQKSSVSCPCF